MAKRITWDFALKLRGVTPDSIPMSKLAEYIADWAQLLGSESAPILRGIVNGSVVLRAEVAPTAKNEVRNRLLAANHDEKASKYINSLQRFMLRDGVFGTIIDKSNDVLFQFEDFAESDALPPVIVEDSTEIDGTVFRVQGKDNSSHIGLIEYGSDRAFSIETKDDALARRFAEHFKGHTLRVRVHGTWRRDETGEWKPYRLIADGFNVLDDTQSLNELMQSLRDVPDNGWSSLPDPIAEWRNIRGVGS